MGHQGEETGGRSDALERGHLLIDPEEEMVPPGRMPLGLPARRRLRLRLRLRVRQRRRRRNGQQVWRARNREAQQEAQEEGAPGEDQAQEGVPGLGASPRAASSRRRIPRRCKKQIQYPPAAEKSKYSTPPPLKQVASS